MSSSGRGRGRGRTQNGGGGRGGRGRGRGKAKPSALRWDERLSSEDSSSSDDSDVVEVVEDVTVTKKPRNNNTNPNSTKGNKSSGRKSTGSGGGRSRKKSSSRDNRIFDQQPNQAPSRRRSYGPPNQAHPRRRSNSAPPAVAASAAREHPHPLDRRATLVRLMNKRDSKKNNDSIGSDLLKSMLSNVLANEDSILKAIEDNTMDDSVLRAAEGAFEKCKLNTHTGKEDAIEMLVDIWLAIKDVPEARESGGSTRRNSIATFIGTMVDVEDRADDAIADKKKCLTTNVKSEKMPEGEPEREYMKPGIAVDRELLPHCPVCNHEYIDHPPSTNREQRANITAQKEYLAKKEALKLFKKGQGPAPLDSDGNAMTKKSKVEPPKWNHRMVRCHCKQIRANPRQGVQCPNKCTGDIATRCEICLCRCNLYTKETKCRDIAVVADGEENPSSAADGAEESRQWLGSATNANLIQRQQSSKRYQQMASNNQLSANTNVASNIVNEAAMAQSLHMVGNPPKPMARQYLQKKVDALNHPLGNTFVKLGGKDVDMRSYGKTTAADARKYNNGLSGEVELLDSDLDDFPPPPARPPSLNLKPPPPHNSRHESTETTTPATGIDDAGVDITPLEISSTRNKIAQNLRENRATMTKSSRKRSAKAVRGLSRPRDATIVNEVKATKGKPTPERAANLLAFMEDDED